MSCLIPWPERGSLRWPASVSRAESLRSCGPRGSTGTPIPIRHLWCPTSHRAGMSVSARGAPAELLRCLGCSLLLSEARCGYKGRAQQCCGMHAAVVCGTQPGQDDAHGGDPADWPRAGLRGRLLRLRARSASCLPRTVMLAPHRVTVIVNQHIDSLPKLCTRSSPGEPRRQPFVWIIAYWQQQK